MELIIYLAIGAIAGFTAGLFGVGGGLIIIPILYVVFTQQGYDPNLIMHMALGTSLATIMVTSLSAISAHQRKKAILWHVVKNLSFGLVLGAFLGAKIVDLLPSAYLQIIIGTFALWVAVSMLVKSKQQSFETQHLPSSKMQMLAGLGIGTASAIFGIGGGSLTVPYLNRYGVVMQKAVATSAACGFPIAFAGAVGFLFFGSQQHADVPHAVGYIHIYAFLGISSMSFFMAKVGVKVAHLLSPIMLKKCFSAMLFCVGSYFLYCGSR